jgi:transposase
MLFEELSNDEWAQLDALVSDEPPARPTRRGRPRAELRVVTNAVLWILTTGEPWSKLPGRYPSGPTCRRRFDEWQANGTLIGIVRVLAEGGRTFAPVPEPVPRAAPKPPPVAKAPAPRTGVFWKSPDTWQRKPLGPMADMTRQLAGSASTPSTAYSEAQHLSHEDID